MNAYKILSAVLIVLYSCSPAIAANGVSVTESSGSLYIAVYSSASPTPGWCQWEQLPENGPNFSASECDNISAGGNLCCPWLWSARSDADGLAFQGSLPQFQGSAWYYTQYSVDITYIVELSEEKLLSAHRELTAGQLDPSVHSLSVTYPDSTTVELFSSLAAEEDAEVTLSPATYKIRLVIEAHQNKVTGGTSADYDELISLEWNAPSPLPSDNLLWGDVKSQYR